uniref:DDE-1 domain-containing protein n=2 Tax=Steinernema glaseri TaxID=37863 RepID=A0A1I7ZR97_9BILA
MLTHYYSPHDASSYITSAEIAVVGRILEAIDDWEVGFDDEADALHFGQDLPDRRTSETDSSDDEHRGVQRIERIGEDSDETISVCGEDDSDQEDSGQGASGQELSDLEEIGQEDKDQADSGHEGSDEQEKDEEYVNGGSPPKKRRRACPYNLETMKTIVDRIDGKDGIKWHLKTVQSRYKFRRSIRRASRRQQIELNTELLDYFREMHDAGLIMRDCDLQNKALDIAFTKKMTDFKKAHNIVSRKITSFVTRKALNDLEDTKKQCESFKVQIKNVLRDTDPSNVGPNPPYVFHISLKVWNTDQTPMRLECVGGHTLTWRGSKNVEAVGQRAKALTHSLTIQPVISCSGELQLPVLVCFAESPAPQCFQKQLKNFKYLHCVYSKYGMMSSALTCDWMSDVFLQNSEPKSVLILDSWTGYKRATKAHSEDVDIRIIPPKGTSMVQPLDLYFNRQLKDYYRKLTAMATRGDPDFIVSVRKNMATLLNITMKQFSAPRFKNMIQYAWYAAGFTDVHPEPFTTPARYAFNLGGTDRICSCGSFAVIRCAICEKPFCIKHFATQEEHDCPMPNP